MTEPAPLTPEEVDEIARAEVEDGDSIRGDTAERLIADWRRYRKTLEHLESDLTAALDPFFWKDGYGPRQGNVRGWRDAARRAIGRKD